MGKEDGSEASRIKALSWGVGGGGVGDRQQTGQNSG